MMNIKSTRRWFLIAATTSCGLLTLTRSDVAVSADEARRPNILFAISDDQSYPHASAYGYQAIDTPAFDRVAREGVRFTSAFTASPGCSPSRAAILTGRYPWQNEHAGTHASSFANKFVTYPALLEQAGYHVGYTGKGWGPGNATVSGFQRNPAGPAYNIEADETPSGIRKTDYAASFAKFLETRQAGHPFCFWYGASEPHRAFGKGIGLAHGGSLEDVVVPAFLPDTPEVRSDILDYCYEIEWFDKHLGRMIRLLEQSGELDNTIIVVTSDNGMAFPRAKANCYEYGIHMPLAIRWATKVPGGRTVDDLVSLIDLMPTFLEAAGVAHPGQPSMSGRSLMSILESDKQGLVDAQRTAVFSSRERHSSSRWNNLAYPQRCIRTQDYLYIRNFRPERWPAGAPRKYGTGNYAAQNEVELGPMHGGYHDIDACPTLSLLIEGAGHPMLGKYLHLAVDRRPAEELYDIRVDPACLENLAQSDTHQEVRQRLGQQLNDYLRETGDPRVLGTGDIFETYKRYSALRRFPEPEWAARAAADTGTQPTPARWAQVMQEFDAADVQHPPNTGGVVFVGSSSIRLWDLAKSFPDLHAVNRGFGGSITADSAHFAEHLVIKHRPRLVVMYAGDNDIAMGLNAHQVTADFKSFVQKVRAALPKTKIAYIAIKPSIKRWNLVEKMRAANRSIRSICDADSQLEFIDIDTPMIGADGRPKTELFATDGLHLNEQGYELWTSLVTPYISD